ncbi:molybdopterin-dependent oxidoreductase, partial [Rhodococcus erythropolis]|nr:molybdopterin-dependent oxidoreductase [Rhodococcus erythropolis]
RIKEQINLIQTEHGNDAMAVYGSASITNEEAYLLGKFARVGLQTKYIDYNGRLCMSAAATAAGQTFGADRGLTNPLSDIPHTRVIILAGTNIAECQPTIMPYFDKAKENGEFVPVSWAEALNCIKEQINLIQTEHGNDAMAVYGSASITNEEAYLLGKFARVG